MLRITHYADNARTSCEFSDDAGHVATGTFDFDQNGETIYSVDHAPTQADFEAITSQLDRGEFQISPKSIH